VVVATLRFGEFEVMLTGDMETKVERRLILEGYDLDSDVLKAGHHGSKTSSSEAEDIYGIKVYRNDVDGDIKLVSDGINYQIIMQN